MEKTYRILHAIVMTSERIFLEGEDVTGKDLKESGADTKTLLGSGAIISTDEAPEDPVLVAERESTEAASKAQFAIDYLDKLQSVTVTAAKALKMDEVPSPLDLILGLVEALPSVRTEVESLKKERDELKAQVAELKKPKGNAPPTSA